MKVLIIDDEVMIRNGLVQVIPWNDHGFTILEPSPSAEDALLRIKEEQPEIIVSDIRMKRMSGLELVKKVTQFKYPKEIILLTGYDEFSYVQEAIKQNVSDYLLKTSSPDEILASVNKARKRLEDTKKYMQLQATEIEQAMNDQIKRLLRNKVSDISFTTLINRVPELSGDAYQVFVINTVIESNEFYQAEKLWNTYLVGRWLVHNGQTLIITKRQSNLGDDYLLQIAAKKIKEIYKEPLCMSHVITTLKDLSRAYEQATTLLLYKWLLPEHILISGDDVHNRQGVPLQECYKEQELRLLNSIRSRNIMKLEQWVRQFVDWLYKHPMATPKSIKAYIQNLYFNVTRYIHQIGNQKADSMATPPSFTPSNEWFVDPVNSLTRLFQQLLTEFKRVDGGADMYVNDAKFYMEEHLKDSITLQDVAKHVHIHPNYLSELIKKETGQSYLELLTNMRIKRAEDHLVNTTAKVKEISHLVGYSDPKYFTSIFKKYFGITPSAYRKKVR